MIEHRWERTEYPLNGSHSDPSDTDSLTDEEYGEVVNLGDVGWDKDDRSVYTYFPS